jgi:hypothetical protein
VHVGCVSTLVGDSLYYVNIVGFNLNVRRVFRLDTLHWKVNLCMKEMLDWFNLNVRPGFMLGTLHW